MARLDALLSAYVADGEYPGFSVLIIRDGQPAHAITTGWQDKERCIAMHRDTIFRIYSMSKAITSAAAMILFEQGRFQLDDPIDVFLPALKDLRVCRRAGAGYTDHNAAARHHLSRAVYPHRRL